MQSKNTRKSGPAEGMEFIAIKATQKGSEMYTACINASTLWRVAYTLPKSRDSPEALERKLSPSKVNKISTYIDDERTLLPNNIIVNITEVSHVTITPINEKHGVFKLSFSPIEGEKGEADDEELPGETVGKYGYVVDGQHRGVGAHQSHSADSLPLVVTLLWNVSKETAFKTFADINENQTKVPKLLTTFIRREISDIKPVDADAFEIAENLNESGVLQDRIRIFQDDKDRWVNSPTLVTEIRGLIEARGVLHPLYTKKKGAIKALLEDYLRAWKETFPAAWGSQEHVLTKAMGIQIMFRIFERVYRRCDFYGGGKHGYANLFNQVKQLAGASLDIEDVQLPLTWESEHFASYSSGAGINKLRDTILALSDFQERPVDKD